jgi:hypothetical protein
MRRVALPGAVKATLWARAARSAGPLAGVVSLLLGLLLSCPATGPVEDVAGQLKLDTGTRLGG